MYSISINSKLNQVFYEKNQGNILWYYLKVVMETTLYCTECCETLEINKQVKFSKKIKLNYITHKNNH